MNAPDSRREADVARIRVREPAGIRELGSSLSFGARGADVVVPGARSARGLVIARIEDEWCAVPEGDEPLRLNGERLPAARELRAGDTLALGEAQIIVEDARPDALAIEVRHLVGNATIPPLDIDAGSGIPAEDDELEIRALDLSGRGSSAEGVRRPPETSRRGLYAAAAAALALLALGLAFASLTAVPLDLHPAAARVRTPGSLLSWRTGATLFVLPGRHRVRAELPGYRAAERQVRVSRGEEPPLVQLSLTRLPGRLTVDTGRIAATLLVDGVVAGQSPGPIEVPEGRHAITVRAPRYLDHVAVMDVAGGGRAQTLGVTLQPAWGTLHVRVEPAGAQIAADDHPVGSAPRTIELDAGVHRLQLSAPGYKTWETSVMVRAGETQTVGPVTLGAPDARLSVRSTPERAPVLVDGVYRGRTPLDVELPAGVTHEISITRAGFATFTRRVFAAAGERSTLEAHLEAQRGKVSLQGEPIGAEVRVDGNARGVTPLELELGAGEHRVEVAKAGFEPFAASVAVSADLPRTLEYRLLPTDKALAALQTAPTISTRSGYVLRLVTGGSFAMGSERNEQGRRPNEAVLRPVRLTRAFYIGSHEVTNAEFRRFRPGHKSGFVGQRTLDLDSQPVVAVGWEDAAAYCNWLSAQDGLAPAYETRGGRLVLKTPVGDGYRLPTEAEWEFAARYASPGRFRRFGWGDALPVPAQAGNLAGAESASLVDGSLTGYRDEFVVSAPVGQFAANALGLHDMEGNVSEWVNDFYSSFIAATPVSDPLGPEQGLLHVVRGPGWRTATPGELRLASRAGRGEPGPDTGFRIARYLDPG